MRSRWRGCVVVVILVAVAAPVAGCSAGDEPRADSTPSPSTSSAAPSSSAPAGAGLARFYEQTPEWADCRGDFECARVTVPVSYSDADGETLELAVVRSRSAKNGDRVGSLLVNPGGPGGSGIDYARAATRVVSAEVRRRYDIVGFDPRGVGESSPVRCRSDEEIDEFVAADGSPDEAAETRR
ncbi:MAG: alpha/beta hydrolase, partial [Nocardioidaceae bacterium]